MLVRRLIPSVRGQLRPSCLYSGFRSHTAARLTLRTMASIPQTQKGVVINKTGGTEVLEYKTDLPVPNPGEGEILVHNDFVGVNYIDTYFRTGLYPAPGFPYILGRESEGTVVKVGTGQTYGFKEGDRVGVLSQSTYAEYTAAPAAKASKIPEGLPPKIAAASLIQGLTALTLIREAHHVNKGDWVLVHAAAGGTGLWLVQLLKAVGANIIGTASTAEKVALATKAGAQHVINYSHEDVKAKVFELTNGAGVIAVFDGVGKDTFDLSLDVVARKGSLLSFGNASGPPAPVTVARLAPKNVRLMRPQLFGFIETEEEFEKYSQELYKLLKDNAVDVRIHEVYPLSEIARAHQDIQGRKTTGKLLLDPSK